MVGLLISGERCVCEIETCLGLTQSNASRHLNVLRSAGILASEKHAQWAYYHISEKFCTEQLIFTPICRRILPRRSPISVMANALRLQKNMRHADRRKK